MIKLIFNYNILKQNEIIGNISVYDHPDDDRGGQLHLFIKPEWRKRWLSKSLAKDMLNSLIENSRLFNISMIYSTALSGISPRLLEFFGFTEYYKKQPKTYYYLEI